MTSLLKSQEDGSSADGAVLSLLCEQLCVVEQPWVHGRTLLPWTAPGEPLICDGPPVSHRNRSTERPKRKLLTSNTLHVRFWPRT